jgi:hypothetical protein
MMLPIYHFPTTTRHPSIPPISARQQGVTPFFPLTSTTHDDSEKCTNKCRAGCRGTKTGGAPLCTQAGA